MYERCDNCKKLFRPLLESKHKKFCSDKCKKEFEKRKKNSPIIKPVGE